MKTSEKNFPFFPLLNNGMGKSQQRKGRSGELELTKRLCSYGIPAEPGQAVSYGQVPDIVGVPGVHVECKRQERLNLDRAMNQAIRDAERFHDGMPAVFHRRNRQPWMVTMLLDDWIALYSGWSDEKLRR